MSRLIPSVRTFLFASAALGGFAAIPAWAQDQLTAGAAEDETIGDIVVTARRREESLLDVPIAVTAYSGAQLEASGAIDVTDIAATTPNVTLEVSRGTNNTLSAFIRGVGQQDPVGGFEAGVGIYLDDVYLNRPQAAVMDIYDVERIEVLRGPQGTLYGRNTIGGALKYVTKRLSDAPEFKLRGTFGSYEQADGVVSGSVPIGDGTVRLGGAVARLSRGGFGKNLTTGLENYNKDVWAARGTIEIVPSSEARIRVTGDYTRDKSNPRGGHRLIRSLATNTPVLDNVYDTRGGLNFPRQDVEAYGFSGLIELNPTDWLTFRAITGYRKDDSQTPIDFDALPAVDLDVPTFFKNKQFSQEVQLLIDTGGFNGLIGGYWLDASALTYFDARTPNSVTALTYGDVGTKTGAVFGDFTYDLGKFSLSVGGRYTWDRRETSIVRNVYLGNSPLLGGTTAPIARQTDFRGTVDFSKFTPRASVSFKPTPDHTIYASYSKGFKGGGFDPRGVGTSAPDLNGNGVNGAGGDQDDIYNFLSFDPETVESYEAGWKASLFDRRLTFALAGFYADYTDVQVPGSVGVTVNGLTTFAGITTNAGKAEFKGVEFEGNLVAARDLGVSGGVLNFSWTLGYLDAKYKRFVDARGIDVASRRAIQNTPKWTGSATLAYTAPVGEGSVNFNTTWSYRGDSQQFELRAPGLDQPAYALWDANLVWDVNDTFSIGIHGRNLTNKRYIVSGYNFLRQNPDTGQFVLPNGQPGLSPTLGAEGLLTAYYGNPRQVFVTGTVKF